MRKILLVSAALMFTAGASLAQTTTSAPAPQGAINAPQASPAPNASPGKLAPDDRTTTDSSMAPAYKTGSANAPAPQGATNAPVETSGPASSPGKTAPEPTPLASQPSAPGSNSAMTMPGNMPIGATHHWTHHNEGGALPADADAGTYLHIAKRAIADHNKMRADDALAHAETRLLSRAVPQSDSNPVDDNPAITCIEHARAAIQAGDMSTAASDTTMAMHQMHHENCEMSMSSNAE